MSSKWLISLLMLSSLFALACDPDEEEEAPDLTVVEEDMGGDLGEQAGISEYAKRYEMRFHSLVFTPETLPTKSAIVRVLNSALAMNFNQSLETPIVVLLDVKDIDLEAGSMELRSGAGEKTVNEEEYTWHPETPKGYVEGTLDVSTSRISGVIPEFVFIATLGSGADAMGLPLRINALQFDAKLLDAETQGEAMIMKGEAQGYITEANGEAAMIELGGDVTSVAALFGKDALDYDSDGDGEMDSWALYATFNAKPTSID